MDKLQKNLRGLDAAATELSTLLRREGIRHAFIGGYATSLISAMRITQDIDVIVDADPRTIQNLLLQDPIFQIQERRREADPVKCDIIRGGDNEHMRLPSAASVKIMSMPPHTRLPILSELPIVHPSILFLTKVKRWAIYRTSHRPESKRKFKTDAEDIVVLLKWLRDSGMHIDFAGYPERPKELTLQNVCDLYRHSESSEMCQLLEANLKPEDLAAVQNYNGAESPSF
ncbi:hypothetical protein BO94DRAFT_528783 [Aspergillus sclerotioniger CBS 115572]|uniref:Uncharacterized protein n=1 Tax=Aspergillus sclerotioniger CBS 115572 TaxID=1450535 RepID=A0A317UXS7_9EURO|nr:hypothetical protein BO94DRAFT_528783 [Aspergillus sclerotioniger CBS 115572]PWY66396.1 hypothetical protein BO94DRAFT_528783 [Aspergillus sclerotioniger CBS 115572]